MATSHDDLWRHVEEEDDGSYEDMRPASGASYEQEKPHGAPSTPPSSLPRNFRLAISPLCPPASPVTSSKGLLDSDAGFYTDSSRSSSVRPYASVSPRTVSSTVSLDFRSDEDSSRRSSLQRPRRSDSSSASLELRSDEESSRSSSLPPGLSPRTMSSVVSLEFRSDSDVQDQLDEMIDAMDVLAKSLSPEPAPILDTCSRHKYQAMASQEHLCMG